MQSLSGVQASDIRDNTANAVNRESIRATFSRIEGTIGGLAEEATALAEVITEIAGGIPPNEEKAPSPHPTSGSSGPMPLVFEAHAIEMRLESVRSALRHLRNHLSAQVLG